MDSYDEGIFAQIERDLNDACSQLHGNSQDSPQWMRRCFMTGKQCIFCPHETVYEKEISGRKRDSVFVIMSFKPILETFYEWSLRPYLKSFGIKEESIRRADQFANTGYVMCEKICLRIQQAGFVVVDLSIYNANVYYELGIAVGLNKPLLVVCDSKKKTRVERLCTALGLSSEKVLYYPNVGYIDVEKYPIIDRIQRVSLNMRKTTMHTVGLLLRNEEDSPDSDDPFNGRDVYVSFPKLLEAAVGVAMRMLENKHRAPSDKLTTTFYPSASAVQLAKMLDKMEETELQRLRSCKNSFIMDDKDIPHSFGKIAEALDSALIVIVDLVSQDPLSYFWLGYCHARNINVVPIYRTIVNDKELCHVDSRAETLTATNGSDSPTNHVLAFDIRALWYMWHKSAEAKVLAEKLAAVFEPILLRDVATEQRRIFWERLTRSGRVLIYNGAVHHQVLNREVVGDWDLRTASELISYLSSTEESVVPDLKSPIYSPETVAHKLEKKPHKGFVSAYSKLVEEQLKGKNCLIVASADVNPITEIILANVHKKKKAGPQPFVDAKQETIKSYIIAFKGDLSSGTPTDATNEKSRRWEPLPRHFCRIEGSPEERGFYIDGEKRHKIYVPQDKAVEKFQILAHLVVARNPFSEDKVVVVLNGVSGPATYGLAQLLTGAGGSKAQASERMLKDINEKWATRVEAERKYNGVEAIVSVTVAPPNSSPHSERQNDPQNENADLSDTLMNEIDNVLFDKRSVVEWEFLQDEERPIVNGNPREFPF